MAATLPLAGGEVIEHVYLNGEELPLEQLSFDLEGEEPVLGAELAEEPNNPILPATKEVVWGGIAFFILFAVLAKLAYPALRKTMQDRTERIQSDLDAAEAAKTEAARVQAEYEASLANAKAEANRLIEEARNQAEEIKSERLAVLDGELAERRAQAMAEIEGAKAQAMSDLQGQISEIAIGAAERVVGANLDRDTNSRLVEEYIAQVGSSR